MPSDRYAAARARAANIIFEHDTPEGRAFDLGLIAAILGSLATVDLHAADARYCRRCGEPLRGAAPSRAGR